MPRLTRSEIEVINKTNRFINPIKLIFENKEDFNTHHRFSMYNYLFLLIVVVIYLSVETLIFVLLDKFVSEGLSNIIISLINLGLLYIPNFIKNKIMFIFLNNKEVSESYFNTLRKYL